MTLGKHFINDLDGNDVVVSALRSLLINDTSLRLIPSRKVLYRQQAANTKKVIVLSGGGSGHEPAHAGYVGEGMLDVAIAGNIFASPSASQILAGLEAVGAPSGALFIVKNYTGDKLNFGLAAEKAKAKGSDVRTVFVEDDVSIEGNELVGNRGLAGTAFVHKIAGAAAAKGLGLDEVERIASKAASSLATVAVSLDRCSVPGRHDQEGLASDELEYGMGIHNEPGADRAKLAPLRQVVSKMLMTLFKTQASASSEGVAVLINNLGGLGVLEIHAVADEILQQLNEKPVDVRRVHIGAFVTSLDGPGVSVTLMKLDAELQGLLDAPTSVPAWPKSLGVYSKDRIVQQTEALQDGDSGKKPEARQVAGVPGKVVRKIVGGIADTVRKDEPLITKYDSIVGDGDCGTTLLQGVNALANRFEKFGSEEVDLGQVFVEVANILEDTMGGTSGAIYAIFFNAVANALVKGTADTDISALLRNALVQGLTELRRYTRAGIGNRTLMDALIPFVQAFGEKNDFAAGVSAATEGTEQTRKMEANFGRSSYVAKDQLSLEGGIPDPGAVGVVSVLKGIATTLS